MLLMAVLVAAFVVDFCGPAKSSYITGNDIVGILIASSASSLSSANASSQDSPNLYRRRIMLRNHGLVLPSRHRCSNQCPFIPNSYVSPAFRSGISYTMLSCIRFCSRISSSAKQVATWYCAASDWLAVAPTRGSVPLDSNFPLMPCIIPYPRRILAVLLH